MLATDFGKGEKLPDVVNILVRPANLSDAPSVADVYLASRKTFQAFAPLVHSEDEVRQWIVDELIPSGGVIVAACGNQLLGMMALSRDRQVGWIDHLYVHPSAVGNGIGGELLKRAKQELGTVIRLFTFQANTASRRFYERHGFRPVAFSEGQNNEERCPDVLYEFNRTS